MKYTLRLHLRPCRFPFRILALNGLLTPLLFCHCFSTLQTARIDEGLHGGASFGVLGGEGMEALEGQRESAPDQGGKADVALSADVGYGLLMGPLGLDTGARIGTYRGSSDEFLLLPYGKIGLFQDRSTRIALLVDFAGFPWVPYFVSLITDHQIGPWTPYLATKRFISHGIAGDDPFVTRFQKRDQSIWAFSGGCERRLGHGTSLLFEAGAMIDRHDIDEWQESEEVTLVDPVFGLGLRFLREGR